MPKEKTTGTPPKFTREDLINKKLEQAKLSDTKVVTAKSNDVINAINLLTQTDRAMTRLRMQIGGKVDADTAMKAITDFEKILLALESFTKEICDITGSRYIQQNVIAAIGKKHSKKDEKEI